MESSAPRLYVFGRYTLDGARARLLKDGEPVALRPKAFDTLAYLVHRHGRLVGKEELIRALWPRVVVTDDSLVKCIQEVRSALGEDGRAYIRTVPRRGYVFEGPVHEQAVAPRIDPASEHESSNAAPEAEPESAGSALPRSGETPPAARARPSPTEGFAAANGRFIVLALAALLLAAV